MADFDDVVLSGTTYKIPKANSSPPWGEELNSYLKALGNSYSSLVGVGDIAETSLAINNTQASPLAVTGLSFDTAQIRAAFIVYSIIRQTDSNISLEQGNLNLIYNAQAGVGEKWVVQRDSMGGDAGVEFTVSDAGVVSYTSDTVAGLNYTGTMRYEAKALLQ